ncbi:nucleotidyltransferase domain-containing protein [Ancylobacter amanitiformis]|uniref:Nucleotidyltransferase n=1 Tax=Ancylobacter amanitiformis TaxID=217069 RepID=A0ABU0LR87_9HYPH|nr:nucleotidyltransferase domain-containing protein [Ancylobacter amanitiformis]MDQ0511221.1 putative nucleotidyltransferase [Ancylobacter amanitiformis]
MRGRTSFRAIPASMDPVIVGRIDRQLAAIAQDHDVFIALAIESGSRAWGFPSPDSDYDCRFIFVRPTQAYLTPWPRRDVIEMPCDAVLDINGWELGKALKLLLRGNATVIEWLTSPISYSTEPRFRDDLLDLSRRLASRGLIARHYFHFAQRQRKSLLVGDTVRQKAIFYMVRPAMALRWLRLHPGEAVAPMHFPSLMRASDLSADVTAVLDELMARKAQTRELGEGPMPAPILRLIEQELASGEATMREAPATPLEGRAEAETFFRAWVARGERSLTAPARAGTRPARRAGSTPPRAG